ncbi:MAG: endolytic transglycosylase MltG [Candidatus Paceibacteria bacterium]
MEGTPSPFTVVSPKRAVKYLVLLLCILGLVAIALIYFLVRNAPAPANFPIGTPITIEEGSSISEIVTTLHQSGVVRSSLLLYTIILTKYSPQDIKASQYVFDKPYNVFEVADKLATGDFTSNLVRVTHREGERVTELAAAVHTALPNISEADFIAAALPYEGTLFPETYFFPPHFTADDVIKTLNEKYEEFMIPKRGTIAASGLSEAEVVILASIIEREANDPESMGMVSGILQNRLRDGMPLQADASIEYVLDKPLEELTPEDLKIDSPYNTYLNKGLPPTPIGNPGAASIGAVLDPTPSDYYFYITGKDGVFYYATTYDDHKRNIARYLK